MFRQFFLGVVWCACCIGSISQAQILQIPVNEDGDQYLFQQTYTNSRAYMNVGQYYGGRSTHYYVGLAKWNGADLNSLAGQTNVTLSLYVQNFVDPVFTNGNTNSQPSSFIYPQSGNFTLKIVALSGITNPALITDAWVKTNMIQAPGIASLTLTNAGYTSVTLGSAVANWIAAGNGPFWLGLVGTASTTSIYTSVHLGTMEAEYSFDGEVTTPANPMYLSTPIPAPVAQSSRIVSGDQMEMTFEVVPSVSYVLKTKSNLSDTNWATIASFVAGSTSTNLTVPMTNSIGRGFYRLEISP